jgi:DNA-directed RNA polymerase subunit RPC12/RpoP
MAATLERRKGVPDIQCPVCLVALVIEQAMDADEAVCPSCGSMIRFEKFGDDWEVTGHEPTCGK